MSIELKLFPLTDRIINCAIEVHKSLGPGLLESAYEECLSHELKEYGLYIQRQKPVPVIYKDIKLDYGYKIDILVEGVILLELKSVEAIHDLHIAQVLTYLKFSEISIG